MYVSENNIYLINLMKSELKWTESYSFEESEGEGTVVIMEGLSTSVCHEVVQEALGPTEDDRTIVSTIPEN